MRERGSRWSPGCPWAWKPIASEILGTCGRGRQGQGKWVSSLQGWSVGRGREREP